MLLGNQPGCFPSVLQPALDRDCTRVPAQSPDQPQRWRVAEYEEIVASEVSAADATPLEFVVIA